MRHVDMSPLKVSQRLRYVAQLRRMCLKLSAAGRNGERNFREHNYRSEEAFPASDSESSMQNEKHT